MQKFEQHVLKGLKNLNYARNITLRFVFSEIILSTSSRQTYIIFMLSLRYMTNILPIWHKYKQINQSSTNEDPVYVLGT